MSSDSSLHTEKRSTEYNEPPGAGSRQRPGIGRFASCQRMSQHRTAAAPAGAAEKEWISHASRFVSSNSGNFG